MPTRMKGNQQEPQYMVPEEMEEPLPRDKKIYHQPLQANIHHFYLYDGVTDPVDYLPLVKALGDAAPTDQFVIHINCWGGDVFSAIEIITAIAQSEAPVIASIEGACASAATMIALACEGWSMSDFGCFMVHAPTMGRFGKFNELNASHDFDLVWTRNLFNKIYKNFLTEEEIEQTLAGKDFWFGAEETIQRLQKVSAARIAEDEEGCEDEDCTCEKPVEKKSTKKTKAKEEPVEEKKPAKKSKKTKIEFTPDKSMPEGTTFEPSKAFKKRMN